MDKQIRIQDRTFVILKQLEEEMSTSKQSILHQALDKFQRDKIVEDINKYYEELKKDPGLWKEECEEREIWESASHDGLDDV